MKNFLFQCLFLSTVVLGLGVCNEDSRSGPGIGNETTGSGTKYTVRANSKILTRQRKQLGKSRRALELRIDWPQQAGEDVQPKSDRDVFATSFAVLDSVKKTWDHWSKSPRKYHGNTEVEEHEMIDLRPKGANNHQGDVRDAYARVAPNIFGSDISFWHARRLEAMRQASEAANQ
eukprot:jgi/Botrbrau1/10356/Bobra.0321s0031.1